MNSQCAAASLRQHRKISASLGRFYHSKSIFLPRYGEIGSIVTGNLQENAAVRTTFVGLTGRMQKARTKAQARRHFFCVAHGKTNCLQRFFVFGVHWNVAQHREVVPGADAQKMAPKNCAKRLSARECSGILFVSEKFGFLRNEKWRFRRKAASSFIFTGEFLGFNFAGFDVWLIECVDADYRAGNRGGDFPAEKFLPNRVHVRKSDSNDRLSCLFE